MHTTYAKPPCHAHTPPTLRQEQQQQLPPQKKRKSRASVRFVRRPVSHTHSGAGG